MDKDLVAKECLSVDERYADLVNGLLLNGEQRILPTDLQEMDSEQRTKFWKKKKNSYRQTNRDLIKKTAFGINFSLIGIENQQLEDAYDMICVLANAEKLISIKEEYKKEGKVNMCQALEEWLEDNRRIGVKQGIEQGIEQAMFRIVCKKIRKNYTLDMIADDLEESVEVIKPLYEKAKKEITR